MGAKQHFSRPSSGRIDRSDRAKPCEAVRAALAKASRGTDAHNNRFNFDAEPKPVTLPKLAWMEKPMRHQVFEMQRGASRQTRFS